MSLENLIPTGTIQYVQTMVSSDDLSKIVCFCSGVTYVYYSSDTGITWTRADNAVDEYSMFNTGGTSNADGTQFFWVYRNVAYTFDIYKSINGLTWTKCIINDGTPVIINKITSNSSGSVVICNDRTTLYKYNTTTEIFDILKQFTNIDISTFCCSNDGLKIYVVSYGVIINYTLDGGNTWIEFTLSINGSSNNILCNNDASEIYIKIDYAESVNIYNIGNLENPIKIKTPIINKYYTNFFKSDRNCNTLIIGQSAFLFKSTDKGITWTQDVCTTPIEWSDFIFTSDLSNLICCTNSDYVYLRGNPNPPVPPIPPTPVVYDFVGKYNDQLIVMFDGRYLLNNKPEYFDDECFLSEKEPSKLQTLDNEIFKLYNTCQND